MTYLETILEPLRQAIVRGNAEARSLGAEEIDSEHFVLGLAHVTEGLAAQAILSFDVTYAALRSRREPPQDAARSRIAHLGYTARAHKAQRRMSHEAAALNRDFVNTEHLLLGLLHPEQGRIALLEESEIDLQELRRRLLALTRLA